MKIKGKKKNGKLEDQSWKSIIQTGVPERDTKGKIEWRKGREITQNFP